MKQRPLPMELARAQEYIEKIADDYGLNQIAIEIDGKEHRHTATGDGPVLALVAGTHGYEYPPVTALQHLRRTRGMRRSRQHTQKTEDHGRITAGSRAQYRSANARL